MKTQNEFPFQSICTRYIGATNTRGSRIKAHCDRGSLTIPYPYIDGSGSESHALAASMLIDRFDKEDVESYGSDGKSWSKAKWYQGALPSSSKDSYCFVQMFKSQNRKGLKS